MRRSDEGIIADDSVLSATDNLALYIYVTLRHSTALTTLFISVASDKSPIVNEFNQL